MSEHEHSPEANLESGLRMIYDKFRTRLEQSDVPILDLNEYPGAQPLLDESFNPVFTKTIAKEYNQPDSPIRAMDAMYTPRHIDESGEIYRAFVSVSCTTADGYELAYMIGVEGDGTIDVLADITVDDILADGPGLISESDLLRRLNNPDFFDAIKPSVQKSLRYNHPKEIIAYTGGNRTLEIEAGDIQTLEKLYKMLEDSLV